MRPANAGGRVEPKARMDAPVAERRCRPIKSRTRAADGAQAGSRIRKNWARS